ncbi:hypothetical protein L7F22_003313 [Adiantum nelumboides]|nr:hypothetical protein [Adiantum nelumboides]
MEFEEGLHGLYDGRLKFRLLSLVMASHLPDDRQPPKSPSELSIAVSVIRRHHLLCEDSGMTSDAHKAAVDSWVDRLSLLLSSTMSEKCWAGVCLLGVTCQECTRQRFLDLYMSWFQNLVLHIKPTDPLFLRGAAFASLTDLLVRLGSIGVRREGTALSVKLVQPVLQLLSEESSKSIWNDGIDMLCTVLKFFPASLKQQSLQAETLLVAKIMEVDIGPAVSQKFARCLAMLPKAHGDAATWNSLFRRLLLCLNFHLDDAFKGMEDGTLAKKVSLSLMPRGQEQTWFLGGMPVSANAMTEGAKRFWQLLVPRVSLLLQCCNYLLINSYPVQVPVPLTAMLALITRILTVDGSPYGSASVLGMPTSSAHQVSLCCELPALHSCALDLLYAILCGVRSQLLPRAAEIVRMLTEYFRRCGLPSLRIKLYNICKHLLISMGVGMASELAPALIDNLLADLKAVGSVHALCSVNSPNAMSWGHGMPSWSQSSNPKKRKEPGSIQMDVFASGTPEAGAEMTEATQLIAVQVAALEATEALLTVGGALRSDHWRTEVDAVVANVAMIASAGSLSLGGVIDDTSCKGEILAFSFGSFQLAAYKALLASVLSPCMHRPPYLSQALTIFRKGRQEAAGTEVSEFCAHGLLALEPLIHPRSLPFASTSLTTQSTAPERAPSSANLVSQIQRPILPLQATAGSTPSASVIHSHGGYSSQMAPPSVKVTDSGMQIEVQGDPYVYVQEDIESWIVDYGGDQGVINDGNGSLMADGFDGDFQAMAKAAQDVHLGNVSARQSLADEEDRVMMSMVGDLLSESRDIPRVMPIENVAVAKLQENDSHGNSSGVLERRQAEFKEVDMSGLPVYPTAETVSCEAAISVAALEKEANVDLNAAKRTMLFSSSHQEEIQSQEPMPAVQNLEFSAVVRNSYSESDSDAIPDIVDGDPDTD